MAEGGGLLNQNPLANSRPLKDHIFNHCNSLIAVSGGKISIAEGSKSGSTMPFMGGMWLNRRLNSKRWFFGDGYGLSNRYSRQNNDVMKVHVILKLQNRDDGSGYLRSEHKRARCIYCRRTAPAKKEA